MPDKPVHYKRLSSELSRLLAFALQLAGVPRQTSYHGDLDQLLLEEPVAAALDEEDRRLVVLAWMLLVADEEGQTPKGLENGGMARLAQRIGELLSISTGKLLDATPLGSPRPRSFPPRRHLPKAWRICANTGFPTWSTSR